MLSGYMIVLRSVTYAQRAVRVLSKNGISGHVVRPDIKMLDSGCGFAVKVSETYLAEAIEILRKNSFEFNTVLIVDKDGGFREMKV